MRDPILDFTPELAQLALDSGELNLVEQLQQALADGTANVGICVGGTLAIIQPQKDNTLFIWAGVSRESGVIVRYQETFEMVARKTGFHRIRFKTKRKGLRKLAPKLGYTETRLDSDGFFVFEKVISHG
ncbi:hypothetical protein [Bowmanella sp. JS7-9]|uniref:Uncharacterized protein n=1 Tax=Pseudobowmanella zhangzhouensis TaxID=1537679 RepID=A0ABW1XNX0_9ALTE|nr:hypothetical protein [Bowmanella sp. JS7-9]TBX21935.1 hypothetical protein TK45_10635 [Bowmanella sp. JS7-9]